MKHLLFLVVLLMSISAAQAQKQKDYVPVPSTDYHLRTDIEPVNGWHHLQDTTKKAPHTFSKGELVHVIGIASPRWAYIETPSFYYYIPQASIQGLDAAGLLAIQEKLNAPLPKDASTGKISYSEVIQLPGTTKNELYARGKLWFAKTFNSAQNVIQADDKEIWRFSR